MLCLAETCLRTNHLRLLTNCLRLFEGRAVLLSDAAVTGSDGKGAEHLCFRLLAQFALFYDKSTILFGIYINTPHSPPLGAIQIQHSDAVVVTFALYER